MKETIGNIKTRKSALWLTALLFAIFISAPSLVFASASMKHSENPDQEKGKCGKNVHWDGDKTPWPDYDYKPAMPKDTRYRDLCLRGAIDVGFDSNTGVVMAPAFELKKVSQLESVCNPTPTKTCPASEIKKPAGLCDGKPEDENCGRVAASAYDEVYVGTVSGVKPRGCMKMKSISGSSWPVTNYNSPKPSEGNALFSSLLAMDGVPDTGLAKIAQDTKIDSKNTDVDQDIAFRNPFATGMRFLGGNYGCPNFIVPKTSFIPSEPAQWPAHLNDFALWMRDKSYNCYAYYILNYGMRPWFTLVRPGLSTSDPLTAELLTLPPNASESEFPDQAIAQSCQPLIRGDIADRIEFPKSAPGANPDKMRVRAGFSPVIYEENRPDGNEVEFLIGPYLKRQWDLHFKDFEKAKPFADRYKIDDDIKNAGKLTDTFDTTSKAIDDMDVSVPCVERGEKCDFAFDHLTGKTDPPKVDDGGPMTGGGANPYPRGNFFEAEVNEDEPAGNRIWEKDDCSYFDADGEIVPSSGDGRVISCFNAYDGDKSSTSYLNIDLSAAKVKHDYCPNVEKVITPEGPFLPRDEYSRNDSNDTYGYTGTDREYSDRTSGYVEDPVRYRCNDDATDCRRDRCGAEEDAMGRKIECDGSRSFLVTEDVELAAPNGSTKKYKRRTLDCSFTENDLLKGRTRCVGDCAWDNVSLARGKCGYTSYNCSAPDPYISYYIGGDDDSPLERFRRKEYHGPPTWTEELKAKYPPVQCAVVPVDIMTFRKAAFDACIMQRITININEWKDMAGKNGIPDMAERLYHAWDKEDSLGYPIKPTSDIHQRNINMMNAWKTSGRDADAQDAFGHFRKAPSGVENTEPPDPVYSPLYSDSGDFDSSVIPPPTPVLYTIDDPNEYDRKTFSPPCATRYWETDDMSNCVSPASIQQCCRIIVKDIVPVNFLKMRTCEGLLQARRDNDDLQYTLENFKVAYMNSEKKGGENNLFLYKSKPGTIKLSRPDESTIAKKTDPDTGEFLGDYGPDVMFWSSGISGTSKADKIAWITDKSVGAPNGYATWELKDAYFTKDPISGKFVPSLNVPALFPASGAVEHVLAEAATRALNDPKYSACSNNSEPKEFQLINARYQDTDKPLLRPYYDPYSFDPTSPENPEKQEAVLVGHHMPYFRWWDTGVSAGNTQHGGSFVNTLGAYDTIVGIGREERRPADVFFAGVKADRSSNFNDKMYDIKSDRYPEMASLDGWRGLLAHQMQTIRRTGMNCIGRYEKIFKPYGQEDFVLSSGGGAFNNKKGEKMPWPLGWRGYASSAYAKDFSYDDDAAHIHANYHQINTDFPQDGEYFQRGLDNAQPGDIIQFKLSDGRWHLAYVEDVGYTPDTDTNKLGQMKDFDYPTGRFNAVPHNMLYVQSWDQGRFPTGAGATTYMGMGSGRIIYKQKVPDDIQAGVCAKSLRAITEEKDPAGDPKNPGSCTPYAQTCAPGCQPSCDDPDYKYCVLPDDASEADDGWNNAMVFRPRAADSTHGCTDPLIKDTYGWWLSATNAGRYDSSLPAADLTLPQQAPNANIINQSMTQNYPSNLFAKCANDGFDPPWWWYMGKYKGPGTGANIVLQNQGGKPLDHGSPVGDDKTYCFTGTGIGPLSCNRDMPEPTGLSCKDNPSAFAAFCASNPKPFFCP